MRCELAQAALAAWNPAVDLTDSVVGHLDACASCRAAFDERFVPATTPVAAPVVATPRRALWVSGLVVAAAAALLLAVLLPSGGGSQALASADPPECHEEPWQPPECPTT